MSRQKISRYIFIIFSLLSLPVWAQKDSIKVEDADRVRGIQFNSREEAAQAMKSKKISTFSSISIGADLVGPVCYLTGDYGQIEASLRLGIKAKYFPIAEVGLGISDNTNDETELHYKTKAPYFKIGCDYNFLRDKTSGNRVYGGIRYAFSYFNFDLDGPSQKDPVWNTEVPFSFKGVSSNCHWAELVFGLEAEITKMFHLGWSARYKKRISQKSNNFGDAWYVPGYGKNGGSCWGATFNLIFNI